MGYYEDQGKQSTLALAKQTRQPVTIITRDRTRYENVMILDEGIRHASFIGEDSTMFSVAYENINAIILSKPVKWRGAIPEGVWIR